MSQSLSELTKTAFYPGTFTKATSHNYANGMCACCGVIPVAETDAGLLLHGQAAPFDPPISFIDWLHKMYPTSTYAKCKTEEELKAAFLEASQEAYNKPHLVSTPEKVANYAKSIEISLMNAYKCASTDKYKDKAALYFGIADVQKMLDRCYPKELHDVVKRMELRDEESNLNILWRAV